MTSGNDELDKKLAELEGLYERDPARFERRSRDLIEAFLASSPESQRARMWGLQRRIDAELSRYRDPVARMNRMVELFWNHVHYFLETLEHPDEVLKARREKGPPAKVVPLCDRKNLH